MHIANINLMSATNTVIISPMAHHKYLEEPYPSTTQLQKLILINLCNILLSHIPVLLVPSKSSEIEVKGY